MDRHVRSVLMRFIEKVPQEETAIDFHLKEQISRAIQSYALANLKQKNQIVKKDDNILLHQATGKLENLLTEEKGYERTKMTTKEMKQYLLGLEKVIKKTKSEEYAAVMARALNYAKIIDKILHLKDRNHIATFFLRLYVRVPPTRISKVIDDSLTKLEGVHDDLGRFSIKNFNQLAMQNMKNKLAEVIKVVDAIKQTCNKIVKNIEEKTIGENPEHLSNTEIEKHHTPVPSLQHHVAEDTRKSDKEKLFRSRNRPIKSNTTQKRGEEIITRTNTTPKIIEQFTAKSNTTQKKGEENITRSNTTQKKSEEVTSRSNTTQKRTEQLTTKSNTTQKRNDKLNQNTDSISENLRQANEIDTLLYRTGNKISEIVKANEDFLKKKTKLELELQRLKEISCVNNTTKVKVSRVVNQTSGFILVEGMHHLREKLEVIEDYKSYARQFAYPKRIKMYDVKKNEITSVGKGLKYLAEENFLFNTRIKLMEQRVQQALVLLEQRATKNDRTISELEYLNTIRQEILDTEKSRAIQFYKFNEFRKQIQTIDDSSFRVVQKKREVLQELHDFELRIYRNYYPKIASAVEEHLRAYESLIEQINSLNKSEKYLTSQAITDGRMAMMSLIKSKIDLQSVKGFQQIFGIFFNQMDQLSQRRQTLHTLFSEMQTINNDLQELSRANVSNTEKTRTLNEFEERVKSFKVHTSRTDVYEKVLQLQLNIRAERAKIELNEHLNLRVNKLKTSIKTINLFSASSESFMTMFEEILTLKERIDDMPKGNRDLEIQKKTTLEQLFSLLGTVDQDLAEAAFSKRQFENVINVESYFNKFEFDNVSNKESVPFVRNICSHARTFEDIIDCYFGSRESVDYYIIHENLSRCLDELDQLLCDDDILLAETVKAMNYIKKLKSQLLNNAYCSD
ncbi:uncharacterized protein LOC135137583 [Zophobas morio]|uniref:uncharacterized protein LOC135137583 n=1 Tax=Zophobas morio TaxID=2755281 RepID=UPI00308309A3